MRYKITNPSGATIDALIKDGNHVLIESGGSSVVNEDAASWLLRTYPFLTSEILSEPEIPVEEPLPEKTKTKKVHRKKGR